MKNQRNLEGIAKLSMVMVVRYLHFIKVDFLYNVYYTAAVGYKRI